MAASFADIILSDPFTFYVGTGKKKDVIKLPSKAISSTSDKFAALIEGNMKESELRCAELEDVEIEDFIRFAEYAIRGDYTIPSWTNDDASEEAADAPTVVSDELDLGPAIPKKSKKAKLKRSLNIPTQPPDVQPLESLLEGFRPQSNTSAFQNSTPIFLAHARLYTFADTHLVLSLQKLTLEKLQQTLNLFHLYPERVKDIIELVRYAYDHNMDRKDDGTVDKLRRIVVEYMVDKREIVGKCEVFDTLMAEGGEFVVDFWHLIQGYLISG